jgi:hypothetical protein
LFAQITAEEIVQANSDVQRDGYAAIVYGKSAAAWLDSLFDYSTLSLKSGISEESTGRLCDDLGELDYIKPLSDLVKQRKVVKDVTL